MSRTVEAAPVRGKTGQQAAGGRRGGPRLPNELVLVIFAWLEPRDLARAALVNKKWLGYVLVVWKQRWQALARPLLGPQAMRPLLVVPGLPRATWPDDEEGKWLAHTDPRGSATNPLNRNRMYPQCVGRLVKKSAVEIKVVLMGDSGVGKSSLLNAVVGLQEQSKDGVPSCFSNFTVPVLHLRPSYVPRDTYVSPHDDLVLLSLWDTEMWGERGKYGFDEREFRPHPREVNRLHRVERKKHSAGENYTKMRRFTYPWTDVFLMCFALDDQQSLTNLMSHWHQELEEYAPDPGMKILCGLRSDAWSEGGKNCVDRNAIKEAKKNLGARCYVECSAKNGEGVDGVLVECVRQMFKCFMDPAHFVIPLSASEHYEVLKTKPYRYFTTDTKKSWFCSTFY